MRRICLNTHCILDIPIEKLYTPLRGMFMSNLMLVEKVKELPEEYVDAVAAYIDKLMSQKKSACGIASKYANIALIKKEKEAMAEAFSGSL